MRMLALLCLLYLATLLACVVFEHPYMAPVELPYSNEEIDESKLIAYRELQRTDYKATVVDPSMQGKHVGALTVLIIRTTPCMIRSFARTDADSSYFEAVVDSFMFEARVDPTRSWWDKKLNAEELYYLEHEQIHFAISELAVRHANAQIEAVRARIRATAATDTLAVHMARDRYYEELKRVTAESNERNAKYDKDTRNGQRVHPHELWLNRIEKEMEETEKKKT